MKYLFYVIFTILSAITIISNLYVFNSYQDQTILLGDISNNNFTFTQSEIENINHKYPSLAINSFPIASLKARYFDKYGDLKTALELSKMGIISNPSIADTYYIKARIHISMNDFTNALDELRKAIKISIRKNYISALYFTLLSELNYQQELIDNFEVFKYSNDIETINFYLLALKTVLGENNPFYISALKNFR